MEWLTTIRLAIKLISDLGISSGGDGPSVIEKSNAWMISPKGLIFFQNLDALLLSRGSKLYIGVRK